MSISIQPASASNCPSDSAAFSVAAAGTGPFTYQWQIESPVSSGIYADITGPTFTEPASGLTFDASGAATGTLGVSNIALGTHSNVIRFRAAVTNACGSVTSNPATLTILTDSFMAMGHLAGGGGVSTLQALSDDGSIANGRSDSASGFQAFRWTSAGGMVGLGDLSGGFESSSSFDCSADGSVTTGTGDIDPAGSIDGSAQAAKWVGAGARQGLGWLAGDVWSQALGVSCDGSTIVGQSRNGLTRAEAFRIVGAGTIEPLGDLPGGAFDSLAWDASADGSIIVGAASDQGTNADASGYQAASWTQSAGWVGLGRLPGGTEARAHGCSGDGAVIVGDGSVSGGGREGFVWTGAGGLAGIGDLPGGLHRSNLWRVSRDGTLAVGYGATDTGDEALIWDAANGTRRLADVFAARGLGLPPGWRLVEARAASANGDTIGGYGLNAGGYIEAWVATLPDIRFGITTQPADAGAWAGPPVFTVVATGAGPFTYQWRKDGVPLTDGGTVNGAQTPTLTLTGVTQADAGVYDCVVSEACAAYTSRGALLTICHADYNRDGFVDGIDYDQFNNDFENPDPDQQIRADYNGDGFVDGIDYDMFMNDFEAGCG